MVGLAIALIFAFVLFMKREKRELVVRKIAGFLLCWYIFLVSLQLVFALLIINGLDVSMTLPELDMNPMMIDITDSIIVIVISIILMAAYVLGIFGTLFIRNAITAEGVFKSSWKFITGIIMVAIGLIFSIGIS